MSINRVIIKVAWFMSDNYLRASEHFAAIIRSYAHILTALRIRRSDYECKNGRSATYIGERDNSLYLSSLDLGGMFPPPDRHPNLCRRSRYRAIIDVALTSMKDSAIADVQTCRQKAVEMATVMYGEQLKK